MSRASPSALASAGPLLALGLLLALPAATAGADAGPTAAPAAALPPPEAGLDGYCPPPPDANAYRVLYCAAMYGLPKALDRYYENVTGGPGSAREVAEQTRLFLERARACIGGQYPPCPTFALDEV